MASPNFHPDVADAALAKIATCTRVDACHTEPTTLTEATTTYTVGNYTLTAGAGNGDWVIANGDTSGRKISLTQQTGNNGTATGAADYLAFSDGSTLLFVMDGDGDTVNSGSPFTINAAKVFEINQPTNDA